MDGGTQVLINNTLRAKAGVDRTPIFGALPATFQHNNIVAEGPLWKPRPDAGFSSIADVNAQPGAGGNLSADPQLVGPDDFHLSPTSPNRGAGIDAVGAVSAPSTDLAGTHRPQPAGTPPDIGPYERD